MNKAIVVARSGQARPYPELATGFRQPVAAWLPAVILRQREPVRFWRQKSRIMGVVASPLVFWLLIGYGLAGCSRTEPPLPIYGQVPEFQLSAQSGQPFDRKALDGKIWVADFIFTTCTGPCPRMSAQMRQVQTAVAKLADVKLVSFTVDPKHDTPSVLTEYAKRYRAQPGRWVFLTGEPSQLNALARDAFKLNNVDGSLIHSTRFVLLDRRSRIRGYYATEDDEALSHLLRDIQRLEREPA